MEVESHDLARVREGEVGGGRDEGMGVGRRVVSLEV